jgi:hypothetical protein
MEMGLAGPRHRLPQYEGRANSYLGLYSITGFQLCLEAEIAIRSPCDRGETRSSHLEHGRASTNGTCPAPVFAPRCSVVAVRAGRLVQRSGGLSQGSWSTAAEAITSPLEIVDLLAQRELPPAVRPLLIPSILRFLFMSIFILSPAYHYYEQKGQRIGKRFYYVL